MDNEDLQAIVDFRASRRFTEAEKLAMEYAEQMCRTPVNVPDELFEKLARSFSEDQILELTATIAFENYRARFNHALLIESDGLYEGTFDRQAGG